VHGDSHSPGPHRRRRAVLPHRGWRLVAAAPDASSVTDLRQMAALLDGLRALGSGRVVDEVLTLVMDLALDVTGASAGSDACRRGRADSSSRSPAPRAGSCCLATRSPRVRRSPMKCSARAGAVSWGLLDAARWACTTARSPLAFAVCCARLSGSPSSRHNGNRQRAFRHRRVVSRRPGTLEDAVAHDAERAREPSRPRLPLRSRVRACTARPPKRRVSSVT